jgi:D-alanine-D-alanine ligase
MMKKKIGLLYGGKSAEHEVSLSTAKAVTQALNFEQYEIYPIFITLDGEWLTGQPLTAPIQEVSELQFTSNGKANNVDMFIAKHNEIQFDVIFPLLHGTNGEDGTVQGFLEVLNIPYVGNGVLASATGMDKVTMKQLFEIAGLKQTPYTHFIRSEWLAASDEILGRCEKQLQWPMFVKPANLGSSVGISKATTREELQAAIEIALQYDRKIIVEQGVVGREIEIAVLGNDHPEVSVVGEIRSATDFYDYESKYQDGNTILVIPAEVTESVYETVARDAKAAFKILDCSGLVRADFFVTADNEAIINEVNTLPGFTPFSMYPLMWEKAGLPYSKLIDRLIELAEERYDLKQQLQYNRD